MDAYAFVAHGRVFTNAQTGNVVFLAVYASQANWPEAARRVPPILACMLGVATAKFLGVRPKKSTLHATLLCQGVELVVVSASAYSARSCPAPGWFRFCRLSQPFSSLRSTL